MLSRKDTMTIQKNNTSQKRISDYLGLSVRPPSPPLRPSFPPSGSPQVKRSPEKNMILLKENKKKVKREQKENKKENKKNMQNNGIAKKNREGVQGWADLILWPRQNDNIHMQSRKPARMKHHQKSLSKKSDDPCICDALMNKITVQKSAIQTLFLVLSFPRSGQVRSRKSHVAIGFVSWAIYDVS